MSITIDAAGRVVIPQPVRRRLGLNAGSRLDVEEIDGGIVLRPESRVTIETAADGLPILRASADAEPVTAADVRRAVEESREWPRP